jgi:hypothetical protein
MFNRYGFTGRYDEYSPWFYVTNVNFAISIYPLGGKIRAALSGPRQMERPADCAGNMGSGIYKAPVCGSANPRIWVSMVA